MSPVNPDALERLLVQANYNRVETQFLVRGFKEGFDLGYDSPTNVRQFSPNLKLNDPGDDVILWNKIMKEVKLGRFAGPYTEPPFELFIQSPVGLVPKDNGKDK